MGKIKEINDNILIDDYDGTCAICEKDFPITIGIEKLDDFSFIRICKGCLIKLANMI